MLGSWSYRQMHKDGMSTGIEPLVQTERDVSLRQQPIPGVSILPQMEECLDRLCSIAHDEQFEVGIEGGFSRELQRIYAYNPAAVLQSLRARLTNNSASPAILTEILQWASRQEAIAVRALVVALLSSGLQHTSPLVRDAAASGLAYLEESAAIPHLRQAIEREDTPELREDLEDLVHSLEA